MLRKLRVFSFSHQKGKGLPPRNRLHYFSLPGAVPVGDRIEANNFQVKRTFSWKHLAVHEEDNPADEKENPANEK